MFRWLMVACMAPLMPAQAASFEYSGSLAAFYEYHSNVSLTELSESASENDTATTVEFSLDGSLKLGQRTRLDGGYTLSEQRYSTYSNYDLRTHLLYLDGSHEIGAYTFGVSHYYARALLQREGFMSLNQNMLYAARLFGNQWYARATMLVSEKRFDQLEGRNASAIGLGGNLFWFSADMMRFMSLGLNITDESADDSAFDYTGVALQAAFSQRFSIGSRDARMQLSGRWRHRDYQQSANADERARRDTHLIAEGRFKISLNDWFDIVTTLERGRYRSTLDIADYAETRLALGLMANF